MRTCHRLGIATVALHTDVDVDRTARARRSSQADEAVRVESYLDIDAVVEAARDTGAAGGAPRLRLPVRARGLRRGARAGGHHAGRPAAPKVMEQMGRKDAAREIAVAAGVPVVPRA